MYSGLTAFIIPCIPTNCKNNVQNFKTLSQNMLSSVLLCLSNASNVVQIAFWLDETPLQLL